MSLFQIIALLLSIAALFSYVNLRFFKLPTTIGVMLISLLGSVVLVFGTHLGFGGGVREHVRGMLERIDFDQAVMQGMLSFLLFAGALHVDLSDLREQKAIVATLAIAGVVISTLVVGTLLYVVLGWLGLPLAYAYCLLFGALISPTDPIAVLGILRLVQVPKPIEIRIAGEALFNDGIGIVVFLVVLRSAVHDDTMTPVHIVALFAREAVGGALFGLAAGWVSFHALRTIDNYQVEVLWTLGLVTGGYALANALHLSGPIAIVVAGLVIGNPGRRYAMSAETRNTLDKFWELMDSILNAVLFVLLGLQMLALTVSGRLFLAGLATVPLVLVARWVSVGLPLLAIRRRFEFERGELTLMTWGGLRGGVAVALALSIPASPEREVIIAITYTVVVCSIAVQGLTIGRLAQRLFPRAAPAA